MGRVYKVALKALAPGEYMPSPAQENTSGQGATADGAGDAVGNQVVAPADAWGAAAGGGAVVGGQGVAPISSAARSSFIWAETRSSVSISCMVNFNSGKPFPGWSKLLLVWRLAPSVERTCFSS